MQPPDAGDDVVVTFFAKDPDSQGDKQCETFYTTDRKSWLVQGKRRGVKVAAQLVGFAADETFCEISDPTMDHFVRAYVRERYGINLPRPVGGADRQRP